MLPLWIVGAVVVGPGVGVNCSYFVQGYTHPLTSFYYYPLDIYLTICYTVFRVKWCLTRTLNNSYALRWGPQGIAELTNANPSRKRVDGKEILEHQIAGWVSDSVAVRLKQSTQPLSVSVWMNDRQNGLTHVDSEWASYYKPNGRLTLSLNNSISTDCQP